MYLRFKLLLILVAATSVGFALDQKDLSQAASEFWKLEDQSSRQMREAADWLRENAEKEVISAQMNDEIRSMIRDYYQLASSIEAFSSRFPRDFLRADSSRIFDELYSKGWFDDPLSAVDLDREQVYDLLFAGLSDLLIFENLRFQFHAARKSDLLQQKLNEIEVDGETGHYLKLVENFMSQKRRVRFGHTLRILEEARENLQRQSQQEDPVLYALAERLDTSLSQEMLKESSFWGRLSNKFRKWLFKLELRHHKRVDFVEYQLSRVFGNAAGALNIQKFLKSIPEDTLAEVRDGVLQPGDIIVEKTEGAITDTFIPGHFGHVAVYIGRPEQLSTLRLMDGTALLEHPRVQGVLPQLKSDQTTLEAIRPGVQLKDITHWTITDLAVLRPESYPDELLAEALVRSLKYVGTDYDFAFDVNTEALIVCSELPYQIFKGINFRTAKSAGRQSISPDDIAVLAGVQGEQTENRPFEMVHFIHEAQTVDASVAFEMYKDFLSESRYDEVPANLHDYTSVKSLDFQ